MDKLNNNELASYLTLLQSLQNQLQDLSKRCNLLDKTIKQTENHFFVFEVHIFAQRSLNLKGYIAQLQDTYNGLHDVITKGLPEDLIKFECEHFVAQFQVLLQLVKGLEQGEAKILYHSYSKPKEQIYQQLQKQYQYEHRLLTMISEQEDLLLSTENDDKYYIKEKIVALKVRYQKCNTYTQHLEFKLDEIKDD